MLQTGILVIHLLLPVLTFSQVDLPQIKAEIDALQDGPEKIQSLINASRILMEEHKRVAFRYARQAVSVAGNTGLKENRGDALSNVGFLLFQSRQYQRAISHLEQTIEWKQGNLPDNRSNRLELAKDFRMIGNSYESLGQFSKAYTAYSSAVSYAQKVGSSEEIAYNYNRMGELQIKLQNFQQAISHFNDALSDAKKSGNPNLKRTVEKNIGTAVTLLQNYLEKQEIQLEVEEVQLQIEGVRDSLSSQQDSNKILISTTNLLTMQRKKDSAEIKATRLDIENKNSQLEAQKAREDIFYVGAGAGIAFFLLIIIALTARSRLRKKAKEAVEAEKHKTEELLFSILPTDVAHELIDKQSVRPREFENVTILFTDFKGFSSIAAHLSPEQLVSELNYVFQAFDQIIEKYGLEKIKTIGDAYMAVAGVPEPHKDPALAAVAAGLDMQNFMHRWKVEKEMRGEMPWELRVGINSGKVIAGVIGTKKFAYDVWGDAVNMASRMESAGQVWEVNISEETYQQIRGRASCMSRGQLPVKNKGIVPMYFVKQITTAQMDVKPVSTAPAPWWQTPGS